MQNDNTQIINTIYKSKKISVETKNDDYRYVKTLEEIRKGEVILIEHCYSTNNINRISHVIQNSPELFNNLYPRKVNWDESIIGNPTNEIFELCHEKAQKNMFGTNNIYAIGLDISNFNHSTTPNATVKYCRFKINKKLYCFIQYIYSHDIINKNEEITISYGNEYFGDNINNEPIEFKLKDNYIEKIVEQYLKKDICKNIMFNHMCISYGIYFVKDIICPTDRFIKYYTNTFGKIFNMENTLEWIMQFRLQFYYEYHLL